MLHIASMSSLLRVTAANLSRSVLRSPHGKRLCSSAGQGVGNDARPAAKDTDPIQISLSEALPDLPPAVHTRPPKQEKVQSQVTTLSNGLKVASEPRFGQFCTVGVCVDSGSRYEIAYPSGVSHFLEKIAFGATEKFNSRDDILLRFVVLFQCFFQAFLTILSLSLEKYGGICDCQSTRDTFLYAASVDRRGLGPTIEILGDAVLRPLIKDEEMECVRQAVQFEIEDGELNPTQEVFGVEGIHAAAFANNTVGLSKVCPEKNVDVINRKTLLHYLRNYHTPDRMVLAGVGVDHDQLCEFGEVLRLRFYPKYSKEQLLYFQYFTGIRCIL